MRVPYSWLTDYLVWEGSVEELAHRLTMAGAEVEEIQDWTDGAAQDKVLLTKLTANRGDLLSVYGLARHASATTGAARLPFEVSLPPVGPPASLDIDVEIADPVGCPRYSALLVRGVKVGPSPRWMQERLLAAGMRPINSVVDCTNYVMWELGQPLHAFDVALLAKDEQGRAKIIVRRAESGERFVSLDDQERLLEDTDVVIADPQRAVAIAGVMGGANSEVGESTFDVLIESAHFSAVLNRKTAMRLGMDTEATYRFQRVVDREGTLRAAQRSAQLIVETAGGELAAGEVDVYPGRRDPLVVSVRPERANAILGTEIPPTDMAEHLRQLDMDVSYPPAPLPSEGGNNAASEGRTDTAIRVTVPSFRPDIEREIDLIEEIGVVHGYENIAGTLPAVIDEAGTLTERQRLRARLGEVLRACGLCETINLTMIDPADLDRIGLPADAPEREMLTLQRSTDEGLSGLRRTLLPSLLHAAEHNANQRVSDVALYEIDRVFIPQGGDASPEERLHLCVLMQGSYLGGRWAVRDGEADFWLLKGILQEALDGMGVTGVTWERGKHPTFRAGHCAVVKLDGEPIGYAGEVASAVQQEFGLPRRAYMAELDAEAILDRATLYRPYQPLARYPAALRDLAIVVDDNDESSAAKLLAAMQDAGGELLVSVEPFDVFVNPERLGAGKRSIAFSLTFQSPERTLTDAEVNEAMGRITEGLAAHFGATVRAS
ncbi:MAG: phenylalanine--tRNA ligase subunit beta [Armatimonadetes bacterium]|nr:phenylalanine--tRNA ligase subunit beta [Armatimonadota bacterium]